MNTNMHIYNFIMEDIKENYKSKAQLARRAGVTPTNFEHFLNRLTEEESHINIFFRRLKNMGYELTISKKSK